MAAKEYLKSLLKILLIAVAFWILYIIIWLFWTYYIFRWDLTRIKFKLLEAEEKIYTKRDSTNPNIKYIMYNGEIVNLDISDIKISDDETKCFATLIITDDYSDRVAKRKSLTYNIIKDEDIYKKNSTGSILV